MKQRKKKLKQKETDLTRRYLIWCYKTTKEELDRIDRYFTQFEVDQFILSQLGGERKKDNDYRSLVEQFKKYMQEKRANALKKKFINEEKNKLQPQYLYLTNRFAAIEKAIAYFLGSKELDVVRELYEGEMTKRILAAKEH